MANPFDITLNPEAGWSYVTITDISGIGNVDNLLLNASSVGDQVLWQDLDSNGSPVSVDALGNVTPTGTGAKVTFYQFLIAKDAWSAQWEYLVSSDLDAGAYTVTGADADLTYTPTTPAFNLDADSGIYVVTGSDLTGIGKYVIDADPDTYSTTGYDAGLIKDVPGQTQLPADPGAYEITGSDANLIYEAALSADPGAYSIAGADADLPSGLSIAAEPGTYTVTGAEVEFPFGYALLADAGAYTTVGGELDFRIEQPGLKTLNLDSGAYATTGYDITITYTPAGSKLCRTMAVKAENRIMLVDTENRTMLIPACVEK